MANGGTDISKGLRAGIKVVRTRQHVNPITSILLLTDGQGGAPTNDQLRSMLDGLGPLPIHCFGFGADHDAKTLSAIAETASGMFVFVEQVFFFYFFFYFFFFRRLHIH